MRNNRLREVRERGLASTTAIEEFEGLVNKLSGKSRKPGQLAQVQNLIPTSDKRLVRRGGWQATMLTGFRSLYRDAHNDRLLGVRGGALVQVDPQAGTTQALAALAGERVSWTRGDDGAVMVFTEADALRIQGAQVMPLRIDAPPAVTVGALAAPFAVPRPFNMGKTYDGTYFSVVATYRSAGREGAASTVTQVPVDPNVPLIHVSVPARYDGVTFYATTPGGEVFYRVSSSETGAITVPANRLDTLGGAACPTLDKQPLPPDVTQAVMFRGRLYVAVGDTLFLSEPGSPHLFDYTRGFMALRGEVRLLLKAKGALYIGTAQRVYRWDGTTLEELVPEGVPLGHAGAVYEEGAAEERAYIWTEHALYRTDPFEEVTPLTSVDPGIENLSSIVYTAGQDLLVSPFVGRRAGFNVKEEK